MGRVIPVLRKTSSMKLNGLENDHREKRYDEPAAKEGNKSGERTL